MPIISAFLVLLALCFAICTGGFTAFRVFAEEETGLQYEQTDPLDDLTGATIGGKVFELSDYPFDENGKPQLISFTEYCYSFYSNKQQHYELYAYVYNPQGLAFDTDTERNKIELAFANKDNYSKYPLRFLSYSKRAGSEGLFYKFKVELTNEQKQDMLSALDQNARIYEVTGIELSVNNVVTEYTIAQTYTYSGYAEGCGSALATSDTLTCTVDGIEKYLTLDVHPTYYRPEGTNGKNDYTQDSLHSVYFSIPKSIVSEYGKLTAIHATWLDAVLAPVLVTGNKAAYDAIYNYLGQDIGENTEDLDYAYAGSAVYTVAQWAGVTNIWGWDSAYTFNLPESWTGLVGGSSLNSTDRVVSPLYWLFYSGDAENSADSYAVSSQEIGNRLTELTAKYGGELVNGRYSRVLFDSVADAFTEVNIRADEEYSLTNEVLGSSWWDKLWGITHTSTFDGIDAIHEVTDSDFRYSGGEVDIPATCDSLYIAEQDFEEFRSYYEANKEENVIYLFRYQVSDYISSEAKLFTPDSLISSIWNNSGDSNAYFMQETVNLDFDIIDVTCTKDNVQTVIPVVTSPVDVIPDATPPVYTEDDRKPIDWGMIFGIIAGVLILILLLPLIVWLVPYLLKGVVWLVSLPFKAIGAASKKAKERRKEKKAQRQNKPPDTDGGEV